MQEESTGWYLGKDGGRLLEWHGSRWAYDVITTGYKRFMINGSRYSVPSRATIKSVKGHYAPCYWLTNCSYHIILNDLASVDTIKNL